MWNIYITRNLFSDVKKFKKCRKDYDSQMKFKVRRFVYEQVSKRFKYQKLLYRNLIVVNKHFLIFIASKLQILMTFQGFVFYLRVVFGQASDEVGECFRGDGG